MSLSQRIKKAENKRELRKSVARLKKVSTPEQMSLLRADITPAK